MISFGFIMQHSATFAFAGKLNPYLALQNSNTKTGKRKQLLISSHITPVRG